MLPRKMRNKESQITVKVRDSCLVSNLCTCFACSNTIKDKQGRYKILSIACIISIFSSVFLLLHEDLHILTFILQY